MAVFIVVPQWAMGCLARQRTSPEKQHVPADFLWWLRKEHKDFKVFVCDVWTNAPSLLIRTIDKEIKILLPYDDWRQEVNLTLSKLGIESDI